MSHITLKLSAENQVSSKWTLQLFTVLLALPLWDLDQYLIVHGAFSFLTFGLGVGFTSRFPRSFSTPASLERNMDLEVGK